MWISGRFLARSFLVLVSVLVASSVCYGGENLLENPTFLGAEDTVPPPGWTLYGNIGDGGSMTIVDGEDPDRRGLLVADNAAIPKSSLGETGLWQEVKAKPGLTYKVTAQIKAVPNVSSTGAFLQLKFVPSNEIVQVPIAVKDTTAFLDISVEGKAPANTTGAAVYIWTRSEATPQFIIRSVELVARGD